MYYNDDLSSICCFTHHLFSVYHHPVPMSVSVMSSLADGDFGTSSRDSPAVTIRTVFPETWIWELAEVGSVKHNQYI